MRDTPVPIPNTTVKTHTADGTALETARESRRPPELKRTLSKAFRIKFAARSAFRRGSFAKKGCMAEAMDAP